MCPAYHPLIHEHINMLGRYLLAVTDAVAKGELRTLVTKSKGGCLSVFTVPLLLRTKPRYNSLLPIIFRGVNTTYAENEDIKCH
jgi:hypothetical protein